MKKRLSLCLILVLLLLLIAPAYAASIQGGNSTLITAEPYLPDIKIEVVVPTSGNVYINPYRLPVEVDGNIVNSQVISDAFYIENQSDVPLSVSVEVTGEIKDDSDFFLTATSTKGVTARYKGAFMYLELHAVSNPAAVTWDSAYDANKHIVIREFTRIKKNMVILDSANHEKRYGVFRLTGDCIQNPITPWTENDGVDVEVVFTFSPLPVGTNIP